MGIPVIEDQLIARCQAHIALAQLALTSCPPNDPMRKKLSTEIERERRWLDHLLEPSRNRATRHCG